ncbi:GNAT family N-acetyltransferase [Stutzerimonas azotifigens]|uniref:GNAT family N-acetyltransferase n=1 Tax=Stutzerimonas azotifigens TaxID=291995 RepID=A0ABR5Z215_9GAMM|nr:GNAT family N-acetyltransferase [Stutzerimonas azotifigens]MBA1274236.1 GNAT family N-acetyltransferase [Stutzerimonas azotifigens]
MGPIQYLPLSPLQRPLLDKFYRTQRSAMRTPAQAALWVARTPDIVAGLCLSAVEDGHWLTGLLVAETHRRAGIASALMSRAAESVEGNLWLFCHPNLSAFYVRHGFANCTQLPDSLANRLERYSRHKKLIALVRPQPHH